MADEFYRALRKLPASTDAWSCPWYRMIMWFSLCALVAGILAGTTAGAFVAGGAAINGMNVTVRRKRGITCPT